MSTYFARTVRGSGPGLLLAHGGGGSVEGNFGPILDDLARTHTVIGADYPGSGATPRSAGPLELDEVADGLVRTAVGAGVKRFAILGYSLGGAVAVRATARHPDRVTGLVLTAGFAYLDNRLCLAADVWAELLAGDRTLLAKFLTLVGTGDNHLNALTPDELDKSISSLAEVIPEGSAEHVALVVVGPGFGGVWDALASTESRSWNLLATTILFWFSNSNGDSQPRALCRRRRLCQIARYSAVPAAMAAALRCVGASTIFADRSMPVSRPPSSRSQTIVAATPWPHPISRT